MTDNMRYFLDSDDDGNWHVVPVDKRSKWEAWSNLDEADERRWKVPEYAITVDNPHFVTFTDPEEDGKSINPKDGQDNLSLFEEVKRLQKMLTTALETNRELAGIITEKETTIAQLRSDALENKSGH